jgi:hypothetical protein
MGLDVCWGSRANYILEFKDKIDFEGKNQIIGQARFLRAYIILNW